MFTNKFHGVTKEFSLSKEREHSACGVGMIVNLPKGPDVEKETSHQLVLQALQVLAGFHYRSGKNVHTGESDGAGIRLFGLPTLFFNKKIQAGQFVSPVTHQAYNSPLQEGQYGIGHYFLSTDSEKAQAAKDLIERGAGEFGLAVVGWRDLNAHVDDSVLPEKAREKKPAMWQAIVVPSQGLAVTQPNLETALQKFNIFVTNQAHDQDIFIFTSSLSSESLVFKGMIEPQDLLRFFKDLQDQDFTAYAANEHGRFATNTTSDWRRAQPCSRFVSHNGEINSAPANADEMKHEVQDSAQPGFFHVKELSDSMQLDAHLQNLVVRGMPLAEAFLRLMPPACSDQYSDELNAMLSCFGLEHKPYNGPAFIVASSKGSFIAKLDEFGLRPSRWFLVQLADGTRQFHAASDDYSDELKGVTILRKGHLEPGGMIMVTPEGMILQTREIMERVSDRYHQERPDFFQALHQITSLSLDMAQSEDPKPVLERDALQRILVASGWDEESITQILRPMAELGTEPIAAMGDDTNPLHSSGILQHISHFFHMLFAQVSSPAIDPNKEYFLFSLFTRLGPLLGAVPDARQLKIQPVLFANELLPIEADTRVSSCVLDMTSEPPPADQELTAASSAAWLEAAIRKLLSDAEDAVAGGAVNLILSDRAADKTHAAIPDLVAVAAVRKFLDAKGFGRKVTLVADSYQIKGAFQGCALLAFGANAIYPRGAYEKATLIYENNVATYQANYRNAIQIILRKALGKLGIPNVNGYINGRFMAALGLDLSPDGCDLKEHPTLAGIFAGIYSPLRGFNLGHVAKAALERHYFAHDPEENFTLLRPSGEFMPEKNGKKHRFGPKTVGAATEWIKAEEIKAKLFQLDSILTRRGFSGFLSDPTSFTPEHGFLDPREKKHGQPYPVDYLNRFRPSAAFLAMSRTIDAYKRKHPTSISDHVSVKKRVIDPADAISPDSFQSVAEILEHFYGGSMSQGALTVASIEDPKKLGAHETLSLAMNNIRMNSASGEGGEAADALRHPFLARKHQRINSGRFGLSGMQNTADETLGDKIPQGVDEPGLHAEIPPFVSTKSKQIASGRFGISAVQIMAAEEMEIKVSQGAKPGEGGELPGLKVSIRFAAQRGGLPGTPFTSPPPHHDIYSIEDLEQLIHDIKTVNPAVKVAVKLVASEGIGTIAVGVAKAGADVINIASNSGGTGAAQTSSIKHSGLPAEIGVAEVDKALRMAGLRESVKLRTSCGLITAEDIILAVAFGADELESGTFGLISLGCKMLRTCNKSCQPGITTDGHLFKGDAVSTERYFLNLAAAVQERLRELNLPSLEALRGRTDLLEVNPLYANGPFDFSAILDRSNLPPPLSEEEILRVKQERLARFSHEKEDALIAQIWQFVDEHLERDPHAVFRSETIALTTQDRSFGARIAGEFALFLEKHPGFRIELNTVGSAGQSYGFVMPKGVTMRHTGPVQDGCGKSMTGGTLVIKTPNYEEGYPADQNTIGGNAALYGASGGAVYINGGLAHRFDILGKGVEVVAEKVGALAFEYMTSGTGLVLGEVGIGLGTGASGGIIFVHNSGKPYSPSDAIRAATPEELDAYRVAIKSMLKKHVLHTDSVKGMKLLEQFETTTFDVWIPKALDSIKTMADVFGVIKTYHLRQAPLTCGMQVWLQQKILGLIERATEEERSELKSLLDRSDPPLLTSSFMAELLKNLKKAPKMEDFGIDLMQVEQLSALATSKRKSEAPVHVHPKKPRPIEERLSAVKGGVDEILLDAIEHMSTYAGTLTQDATGCSGCRAQSCAGGEDVKTGCPSGKKVNSINTTLQRLGPIKEGKLTNTQWMVLREAFELQIEESPFIAYTGAACPAPCQDACTETIPSAGPANPKRGGKPIGEHVHIKDIEYYLYQVGTALGWFDGQKKWSEAELHSVFGSEEAKGQYDKVMRHFNAPFARRLMTQRDQGKELIIVGSGPAAMEIAFRALRDGVPVVMYEKSDKAGGYLVDGIPTHKFEKSIVDRDFEYLKNMGLKLHLKSEVVYDDSCGEFRLKGAPKGEFIASRSNENQYVVVCPGAGAPRELPSQVTADLGPEAKGQIVQAVDFLKAANDIAAKLQNISLSEAERNVIIQETFGHMDPRGKNILVVGGGDTQQDVTRWIARYFNLPENTPTQSLTISARAPAPSARGIADGYPASSHAPTKENKLRAEEVAYVKGEFAYLEEPSQILSQSGKLNVTVKKSVYKGYDLIQEDPVARALFEELPREARPLDYEKTTFEIREGVDMVICALGFQGKSSIPLVKAIEKTKLERVFFAGDVTEVKPQIIVGAQANAKDTYEEQIKPLVVGNRRDARSYKLFPPDSRPRVPAHLPDHSSVPIAVC